MAPTPSRYTPARHWKINYGRREWQAPILLSLMNRSGTKITRENYKEFKKNIQNSVSRSQYAILYESNPTKDKLQIIVDRQISGVVEPVTAEGKDENDSDKESDGSNATEDYVEHPTGLVV